MSTNGNTKKRKLTRLEEQCSKITDNKPIDEKIKSTVKFFKTSKAVVQFNELLQLVVLLYI